MCTEFSVGRICLTCVANNGEFEINTFVRQISMPIFS